MNNSPAHILLAEDNEDDVFLMRRALKATGQPISLAVVVNGQEAIDYLSAVGEYADRNRFPHPMALFLDLKMPHKTGFDVLWWLKERSDIPKVRVAVLSSSNHPKDMSLAKELGADSYLIKPPNPAELIGFLSERSCSAR